MAEEMLMMSEEEVNDIIHRWQKTPEDNLKPEDLQQFKTFGSACLTEGKTVQLLTFLQDEKNQGIVASMGSVLLASLVNEVVKKEENHDDCQAAITHLMKTCSPEGLLQNLLELTEDITPGAISETILALLPHLQTVLHCLQERKAASLGLVLSGLQNQLSRLPVPYTRPQEEADEFGLCRCCNALAAFTKPFIEEVTGRNRSCVGAAEDEELRIELFKFCMRSLREPLLEAELSWDSKSPLWLFASEIVITLPAIQESLSELLLFTSVKKSTQTESWSKESRACLAYLLFVQLMAIDSFPAVFSPVFILRCNMEHVSQLLSSKKESHLLKGLALYAGSLERVQDNILPVSLLDLQSFYRVPQNLKKVLTDCPMRHLRESALRVFQLFMNKLDVEGKHKFFRCMLKTSSHAGVQSYIIKNIKSQVEFSMQPGNTNKWFLGAELLPLLGLVFCLPQGAGTDLLSSMDRIMESLNLLRYLLLRDFPAGVCEELSRTRDEYLRMLRVCISMSRSHYFAELKALREDQKLKAKEARDAARSSSIVKSITVKHANGSNVSPEVHHQVLQSALVTFDLMESLIVRIEEITEEKQRLSN